MNALILWHIVYIQLYLNDYLGVVYDTGSSYKKSVIKFSQDFIVIDTLGNVLTPEFVEKAGAWFVERVADLLPMEYVPIN